MRIRFTNPFLAFCGLFWSIWNMATGGSIFTYFMFGVCFGLIYLNYQDDKKNN
jgi:hypothetical protein